MDRQDFQPALKYFEEAFAKDPNLYAARLNQGIALAGLQKTDDALAIFLEAARKFPENPRAWFNLGLVEKSMGNNPQALEAFEHVRALDPNDAETYIFIGQIEFQTQEYDKALDAYQKALALNPFAVTAEFGAAQSFQRLGDAAHSREHFARFQHISQEKLGKPITMNYGDQGKYSLAEEVAPGIEPAAKPIPVHFADATGAAGLPTETAAGARLAKDSDAGAGACVIDYDADGRANLFLVNANGSGKAALYRYTAGGKFEDVTKNSGLDIRGGISCAVGDYDNDGKPDLAVSIGGIMAVIEKDNEAPASVSAPGLVALFHNEGSGVFKNVTQAAGIHTNCRAMGMTFLDYDHDGDLDLYATCMEEEKKSGRNALWRNNSNGTFTEWTELTGLSSSGTSVGVLGSDLNNDRAIDFVVTGPGRAPEIFFNPREGKFRQAVPWSSPMPASGASGIAALDFDKDGWMDLAFTHPSAPGLTLWRNREGKSFDAVKLPDLGWVRAWGVAALDYDNDGWVDLAAAGEDAQGKGHVALLRNEGKAGFRDVSKETGLDQIALKNPRGLLALDYDGDGATDLLITQAGGPPVLLRNEGGNKNNWIRFALRGLNDNKSGIGAKLEVFAGEMKQKWEVAGGSGYLGQGPMEITAGLGDARQADVARMLWPTGVLQDEIELKADTRQQIQELDRRGSSCPILFVWNGTRFEFLADVIGPGIVGHWIGPNLRDIPNPEEYLKVPGESVRAENGKILFRMIEPMEELDYLDRVRLLAVDHPAGVEVYPNAYFASNPPFPEFKVIASGDAHPPAGAWDDQGRDVLPELLRRDRHYLAGFTEEPFAGFAKMHSLVLDLGPWDAKRPLRLLMDGFTDYFSANSMYAAWQAGIQAVPPYVEAERSDGTWTRVVDDMGFPAGLARTMVADLTGKLPPGTRRIRITTNLKIYWDRIRVDNSNPNLAYRLTEAPLADARLHFRGYPQVIEGNPRDDLTYDYENVSTTGPYTRQTGNYTRFGGVKDLLEKTDEEYVIFGSGDEVAADFDASRLPALPAGWTRDYFFYADGFAKDMDFYAAYGDTVAPLPFHTLVSFPYPPGISYPGDEEHLRYNLEYNTRGVAGPAGGSFQFRYPRALR